MSSCEEPFLLPSFGICGNVWCLTACGCLALVASFDVCFHIHVPLFHKVSLSD